MHLTRRQFLGSAALAARTPASGTVLVALQLAGGNDGLNTVVPYEDDHYGRSRTTLRLTAGQVRKIAPGLGFHPELRGFLRLFEQGRLAVLQGVGYPNMQRDHGAGMRNWQTAADDRETGWLGRAADHLADPDRGGVPAVFAGAIPQPLAIHARRSVVPCLRSAQDWTMPELPPTTADDFTARVTARAREDARKIAATTGGRAYPDYRLAQSLRTVAQLIRAEIGIRIYLVEQGGVSPGGFDNHSNQAGNHAVLLRELSESVAAFCLDMAGDGLLDRVLLMTYSEFGRTLSENGRHGTGHGAAAPVFLAGGRIKGGLAGAHPSLADLEADAPKPHTDFRRVYATALERWLGVPSVPILGAAFDPLDVVVPL